MITEKEAQEIRMVQEAFKIIEANPKVLTKKERLKLITKFITFDNVHKVAYKLKDSYVGKALMNELIEQIGDKNNEVDF